MMSVHQTGVCCPMAVFCTEIQDSGGFDPRPSLIYEGFDPRPHLNVDMYGNRSDPRLLLLSHPCPPPSYLRPLPVPVVRVQTNFGSKVGLQSSCALSRFLSERLLSSHERPIFILRFVLLRSIGGFPSHLWVSPPNVGFQTEQALDPS